MSDVIRNADGKINFHKVSGLILIAILVADFLNLFIGLLLFARCSPSTGPLICTLGEYVFMVIAYSNYFLAVLALGYVIWVLYKLLSRF